MTTEVWMVVAVVGLMGISVVAALVKEKKGGKETGCEGCPNYSTCRAHIGCNNRYAKKKEE